ncbi:MAG: MBL fold metallo-hydrolase [Clostridiales bacterium]|nr:MBL fold metallo-hydrolase [Clostridiales bacterium]
MQIKQFVVGDVATNCYLVYDEKTLEGAIVDPGDNADRLIREMESAKIKLKYILLTHAHFDHILAVGAIKRATGAQVVVSRKDEYLFDASASLSPFGAYGRDLMNRFDFPGADIWMTEELALEFGGMKLKFHSTPGHTPGSHVIQLDDSILFTGDTLFCQSCGRTDLPGGSWPVMLQSLKKLYNLPGDYQVLPGHEGLSTLERERKTNPYMRQAVKE